MVYVLLASSDPIIIPYFLLSQARIATMTSNQDGKKGWEAVGGKVKTISASELANSQTSNSGPQPSPSKKPAQGAQLIRKFNIGQKVMVLTEKEGLNSMLCAGQTLIEQWQWTGFFIVDKHKYQSGTGWHFQLHPENYHGVGRIEKGQDLLVASREWGETGMVVELKSRPKEQARITEVKIESGRWSYYVRIGVNEMKWVGEDDIKQAFVPEAEEGEWVDM